MTQPLIVRRETSNDFDAIRHVHTLAFAVDPATGEVRPPGPVTEAVLVDDLRRGAGWIPQLSLVADQGGEVVGHVVCTRGWVEGTGHAAPAAALGLGPIGVLPALQRGGVGSSLMYAVIGAAEAIDESLVCLVGSTEYYPRFGFVTATSLGVVPPDPAWGPHFQALLLTAGRLAPDALRGTFRFDPAFGV